MAIEAAVDVAVEEVAGNLEELAEATRSLNTAGIGYLVGGLLIGAGIGFYFGRKFNKEKIRAELYEESREEIEDLREIYQARATAAMPKPPIENIIRDRGYTESDLEIHPVIPDRPLPSPVPGITDPRPPIKPTDYAGVSTPSAAVEDGVVIESPVGWDFPTELASRTKEKPYVIHENEYRESDTDYLQATLTYYTEDDVLAGDDDRPLPNPDIVIGPDNLKWGHGSNDPDVVYVRNDEYEHEFEITRSQGSYEVEVLGHTPDAAS